MIYKGMKQGQSGTYVYTQIEVDKSRVIGRVNESVKQRQGLGGREAESVKERKEMRRKDTERGRIGREKELKRERRNTCRRIVHSKKASCFILHYNGHGKFNKKDDGTIWEQIQRDLFFRLCNVRTFLSKSFFFCRTLASSANFACRALSSAG